MTTLSALKATIADDLARSDLTTQIAAAIESAIEHFRTTRFYFNETRAATFSTVSTQAVYSGSDDADIPLFFDIDDVFVVDSGQNYRLKKSDPQELEYLTDTAASSGRPYRWAWFEQSIRLYPVPDAVYTVRPVGAIEKASPASDATENNVWMTEAYELLRCRAKWYLYGHTIREMNEAAKFGGLDGMGGGVGAALYALRKKTNSQRGLGRITPTDF